jgi:hypothetical protein
MNSHTNRRTVAVVILAAAVGLSGCSAVKEANTIRHDVDNNKATISAFTTQVKAGEATPFKATYITTGSSPATIVYAVKPPTGLAFSDTPSGSTRTKVNLFVNSSGEYACSQLQCQKLNPVKAATENKIFDFYTPAHWINFLKDFSLAAGFAGDKVTSSTMTVNGFTMSCVNFRATGIPGKSTICSTAQGILGYVKIAGDKTRFEIKSFTASPPASLFQLPRGATVTAATQ